MGPVGSIARLTLDHRRHGPVRRGHHQAAIEFTAERKNSGTIIRGREWYRFHPGTGLIAEIRGYLASPSFVWVMAAGCRKSEARIWSMFSPGAGKGHADHLVCRAWRLRRASFEGADPTARRRAGTGSPGSGEQLRSPS
jgi:hypothetical protein